MSFSRGDIAGFYCLALDFRLIGTDAPSIWADEEILRADVPDEGIIDLALTMGKPIDRVIHVLRQLADGSGPADDALRLFGGLLWRQVAEGQLTTFAVAHLLYKFNGPKFIRSSLRRMVQLR